MPKKPDKDKRNYIEKTIEGDIGAYSTEDSLDVASTAAGFIPGTIGNFASAPFEAAKGSISSARELGEDNVELGRNLELEAYGDNRVIRRKLAELDDRATNNLKKSGVAGVGGVAGGAVGTALIPVPILGSMGGSWIGSIMAEKLYDGAVQTQDQDAVGLVIEMKKMHEQGETIPPELVFAALASNLPDKEEKKIEDRLETLTGSRKFSDAVQSGNMGAVTRLMKESDTDIRVDTHMPFDINNPNKTTAEQYADLINSGQMDVRALLFRNDMPSMTELVAATGTPPVAAHAPVPSQQPRQRLAFSNANLAALAADMNAKGFTAVVGPDGMLQFVPSNLQGSKGKGPA